MFLGFLANLDFLIALAAIIPSVVLGFFAYFRGEQNVSKMMFTLGCVATIFWAVVNYFSVHFIALSLFWVRLVLFFAVFHSFIFFLFVHVFPEQYSSPHKRSLLWGTGLLSAIAMGATVSPFVFKSVAYQGGRIIPVPGPLISLFALTILLLFVLGGVELKRKLAVAKDVYRAQVLYVAIGYTAMLVLLILTQFIFVVVFHNTFFVSWGPIFTLPFIITTSYAILRHHLFNIRVIATELFTASIVLVFLFNIFFSRDLHTFIFNSVLFIFVSIFGIFLIQGTLREIHELERVSATKSEFISIASHQLRTPLTATKGYISMLLEGTYGTIAQKQMEVLKRVYASNERLANIVEDLLNVSRMDQGRLVYTFVPTDLVHVIEEVIDELKITAETKHIDLVFEKPKDGVSFIVPADKEKLHQVIANLVDNAIKYTMKGSVRVMLKKNDYPSTITIIIQDTGIGLTAEDKRKIFEMFSRGQEGMRVNTKGSGLGLFIAKTIAEAHKGTLRAESAGRNKGSSFVIELPAEKEKTDVAAAFLSDLQ